MTKETPTSELFSKLTTMVKRIELNDLSTEENLLIGYDEFYSFLIDSHAPKHMIQAAASLCHAISKKQREIVLTFQAKERREKLLDRIIFYVLEILTLIATTATTIICVITKVHWSVTTVCIVGNLFFACALLFFHIGELGRVEKIVERTVEIVLSIFEQEERTNESLK